MKKWYPIVIVIMTSALVLSACGGAAPAPSGNAQVSPTEAGGKPAAQSTEEPVEKPTPMPAADDTKEPATPESLELSNVTSGLDELNSYKASFNMTFEAKDDSGQTKTSTMAFTEEFVKDPAAKRTTITGFGAMMGGSANSNSSEGAIESIEVGGKQYSKIGEICTQVTADSGPQANTMLDPNSLIGDVRGKQRVGSENINGVPTAHYKIDVSGLEMMGYLNGDGDVWVADPGNYVVKYTFTATGKGTFFGSSDKEGSIKWDYEVSDVNQPINIQAPENCGGAAEDIPMMADAQDQAVMGTLTTYSTPGKFADVVAFYEKEMKAKGWAAKDEGGMSTDSMVMKSYAKDGRTVQIIISADSGSDKTSVMITEEKQ